jgi:hypothetical protein
MCGLLPARAGGRRNHPSGSHSCRSHDDDDGKERIESANVPEGSVQRDTANELQYPIPATSTLLHMKKESALA